MIAVCIAKKLSQRRTCAACKSKIIANESTIENYEHSRSLSEGGLTYPSLSLRDFVFKAFRILQNIINRFCINDNTHYN